MANGKAIRVQTHLVWVPEGGVVYLSDVPAGFVIREIPPDALRDPSVGDVEVLVPPPMRTAMAQPLWGRMTSLRLVQTLSAGVESLLLDLPPRGDSLLHARRPRRCGGGVGGGRHPRRAEAISRGVA